MLKLEMLDSIFDSALSKNLRFDCNLIFDIPSLVPAHKFPSISSYKLLTLFVIKPESTEI